jgi:hypothetical protein
MGPRLVLGETWVSHLDKTWWKCALRCSRDVANHPIVGGVRPSFWLPDDVYGLSAELNEDCTPVLLGQPLVAWAPEAKPNVDKKPIPIAWMKTFVGAAGKRARVFTTTMGHGEAFKVEDFRRLFVNACYWCCIEDQITPAKVDIVGAYDPGPVGGKRLRRGIKPSDLALKP